MDRPVLDPAARQAALDWILRACRVWLGTAPCRAPAPRVASDQLWPAVGRLARLHNLEPLLYRVVDEGGAAPLAAPESLRNAWDEAYHLNVLFNTTLTENIAGVLAGCRSASLPVVMFKGLVTAARGYDDLGLRVLTDVDLICIERDLPPLAALARRAGYRPVGGTSIYHLEFFNSELQCGLELHFELYDFLRRRHALAARLLDTPPTITVDGVPVPVPSPELDLVLDVAHLVNHDFALTLKHLLDVAAKLARWHATLDWDEILTVLEEIDLGAEFGIAIEIAGELFGVAGWPAAVDRLRSAESQPTLQAIRSHLCEVDRYAGRRALGDTGLRVGWRQRAGTVTRLLLPSGHQLQALYGTQSLLTGYCFLPAHVWQVVARGLRHVRRAPRAVSPLLAMSTKRAVYRRRLHTR